MKITGGMCGRRSPSIASQALLVGLVLAFTAWFSVFSVQQHDAHLTHKADLGQMDLAIWNTAHGRFVQEIKDEAISTRLTDHFEPIFAPVSLIFWLWDDVRALLILQAAALALGALPIFLLARRRLAQAGVDAGPADWAGLALAAVYLLYPALEAPAVADFHALALAPSLVAWALWTVEQQQWGRFALAAVLLAGVQEGMALLAAALGAYALARSLLEGRRRRAGQPPAMNGGRRLRWGAAAGAGVALGALAWFYAATVVIIPHFAALAYGAGVSPYAARYGELSSGLGGVVKSLLTRPDLVLSTLTEPLRLRYLFGLLAPTSFLALLGPEILLIGSPLLLANLLSGYPLQYSGELHYSAPLAPYFVAAGAVGLSRVVRLAGRAGIQRAIPISQASSVATAGLVALVVVSALAYHAWAGYTPVAREYQLRLPGGWPEVTSHDRLLGRFLAQIPTAAPVSVTPDLYPHLSHRELIYQFPQVGQADWTLVDVSGATDRHPVEIQSALRALLANGWGVADAADGYVLLQRGSGRVELPDSFRDFARAPGARPQYPLDVTFGGRLKLIGYDVLDDAKWRRTGFRLYWQALAALPDDTAITLQVAAPDGSIVDDTALRPMPALLWYPPASWQVGEVVVSEKPAWYLPADWAPLVGVTAKGHYLAPATGRGEASAGLALSDGLLRLPPWARRAGSLGAGREPGALSAAGVDFRAGDWGVRLLAHSAPVTALPGRPVTVALHWEALGMGAAQADYTVFLHLRDAQGRTVANADATPSWYLPYPTSRWLGVARQPFSTWDAHTLALPRDLPRARYALVAGLYDWQTGQRLLTAADVDTANRRDNVTISAGQGDAARGNGTRDEYVLGYVNVVPGAGPAPDLACLLASAACASQ